MFGVGQLMGSPGPARTILIPPSGLVLWLRADMGLYKDTDLTIPATVNNDEVLGWKDQSTSLNHALKLTGTPNPVLKANTLNGRPTILMQLGSYLTLTASSGNTHHLFVVLKDTNSTFGSIILGRFASNQGYLAHIKVGGAFQVWVNIGGTFSSVASVAENTHFLAEGTYNGTQVTSYSNGVGGTPVTVSGASLLVDTIGRFNNGTPGDRSFDLAGNIAEIIRYNRVLQAGEQTMVRNYLNAKYALY